MPVNAEGKRLKPCRKIQLENEKLSLRYIPQKDRPDPGNKAAFPQLRKTDAMITRVCLCKLRITVCMSRPVKGSPSTNHAADCRAVAADNFVADSATTSAPCSIGRIR